MTNLMDGLKRGPLRQETPYLMLPPKEGKEDVRELYGMIEGKIVTRIKIPLFKSKKCLESMGWLLASEENGNIILFNPFSSVEILLPHQTTFPDYDTTGTDAYIFVEKMTLSSNPSESSNFVLMTIYGGLAQLGFWIQGNKTWKKIGSRGGYADVVFRAGHFYALDFKGSILVFNFIGDQPIKGQVVTTLTSEVVRNNIRKRNTIYILKTSYSLLVVIRGEYCDTVKFNLYEVDFSMAIWKEVNSLGSNALFVGHNSTIVVEDAGSRFQDKIKSNHIYFTYDNSESYIYTEEVDGKDMGVYNVETGRVEPFFHGEVLLSKISHSTWINFA